MTYDQDLADRLRELISSEPGVSEQRMFGGLAFLVNGKLAIAASSEGGVLVRVDPAETERLVTSTEAVGAVMGGRRMRAWLRVAPENLRTERQLDTWVQRGVDCARSLPTKGGHRRARAF